MPTAIASDIRAVSLCALNEVTSFLLFVNIFVCSRSLHATLTVVHCFMLHWLVAAMQFSEQYIC